MAGFRERLGRTDFLLMAKVGSALMPCSAGLPTMQCKWCETDRILAGCQGLVFVVRGYCENRGPASAHAFANHLAGECRRCHDLLLGMCREALASSERARELSSPEEVSQLVLLRTLPCKWRPERGPLSLWLKTIARNLVIDLAKSAYARTTRTTSAIGDSEDSGSDTLAHAEAPDSDPARIAELRDLRAHVRRAVQSLPFSKRQLITLRYTQGHKLEEIAKATGTPVGTVHRRIRKVLRELADMLTDRNVPSKANLGDPRW